MSTASELYYHVVRPCPPHLEKPAIFLSLKDAKHFVDKFYDFWVEDDESEDVEDENRMKPSFIQTFNIVQEFVQYTQQLQHQLVPKPIEDKENNNNTEEDNGTDDDDDDDDLDSDSDSDESTNLRKRRASKGGGGNSSTKRQRTQGPEENEEQVTPGRRKRGRPRKHPVQPPTAARRRNPKKKWQKNMKLLHEYREKHGTAFVKDENCVGEFANLKKFFQDLKYNMRCFKGITGNKPAAAFDEDMFNYAVGLGLESVLDAPPKIKKIPRMSDKPWEEMYQQLKEYHEINGHANVPELPRTPLSNWCRLQKQYFKKIKQGKKTILTPERIGLLQKLGFKIETIVRQSFDERAAEWLEYRTKHGKDPNLGDTSLGKWVAGIRLKYRYFKEGRKRKILTQEQIDRLTEWGFDWREEAWKPEGRGEIKTWEERYQELVEFYNEHGHTKVKQQGSLGHWVHRQRRDYTKMKQGRKHSLTKEKLGKLKAVNFVFLTRKRPTKRTINGVVVPITSNKNPYDLESDDENDNNGYNDDRDDTSNGSNKKKKYANNKQKNADESDKSSSSDEEYDEEEEYDNQNNFNATHANFQYQQQAQLPYQPQPLPTVAATTTQESPLLLVQRMTTAPWDQYNLPRQSFGF